MTIPVVPAWSTHRLDRSQFIPPVRVVECFANEKRRPAIVAGLRRLRYPGLRYLNRYAHTLWAVYERRA
jgi:hypothetical protein